MIPTLDENLVNLSIHILREAKARFDYPCVLWSTGKDSMVMLSLIREAFLGEMLFPAIHIDTGKKFPEIYQFRDKISKEWGFNAPGKLHIIHHPHYFPPTGETDRISPLTHSHFECCTTLKTEALSNFIRNTKADAIIVSIRRDEHGIRGKERYMSPRDKAHRWRVAEESEGGDSGLEALQEVEMAGWGLFQTEFEGADHVRVHPILHWTELDVWLYIKSRNLPVNPLYFADYVQKAYGVKGRRYRSIGCQPCTLPIISKASTVNAIIEELQILTEDEREGRAQDKEADDTMEQLRALGYM